MHDSEQAKRNLLLSKIQGINETRKSKVIHRDIAILYRTNAQSRVMEEVLLKSNIEYPIVGGTEVL